MKPLKDKMDYIYDFSYKLLTNHFFDKQEKLFIIDWYGYDMEIFSVPRTMFRNIRIIITAKVTDNWSQKQITSKPK